MQINFNEDTHLILWQIAGITSFDLSATVTSPGGVTEDAEINEVKDGLYAVHFVPKELGVHTVSVRYKDIHIPGNLKSTEKKIE